MVLKHVLNPASLAVVGASERKGSFAWTAARNALASDARIYFVNPSRDGVLGQKCYRSVSDLPETVECIVICTPQETNLAILKEAGEKGVKGAVLFASGFEDCEQGARDAESLKSIASEYGMTVIGPNGIGLVNYKDKKAPWTMGLVDFQSPRERGIAVTCQSGMMVGSINAQKNIPMSYGVSVGNCSVVKIEDVLEYYADDGDVKVIGAYIEGVSSPEVFISALEKAYRRGVPVVALKSGRHKHTASAARYHTAAMRGSYDAYIRVLKTYGAILVNEVEEFASTLQTIYDLREWLPRLSLSGAGLNGSGGLSIVSCDLALDAGLRFPQFQEDVAGALKDVIPGFATVYNPLDYTTAMDAGALRKVYEAVGRQEDIHFVYTGIKLSGRETDQKLIEQYCDYARALGGRQLLFLFVPAHVVLTPVQRKQLLLSGACPVPAGSMGFRMIGKIGAYAEFLRSGKVPSVDCTLKKQL